MKIEQGLVTIHHSVLTYGTRVSQFFPLNVYNFFLFPKQSLMAEMWKEIKFSLDLRAGDTKPVVKDSTSSKLGGSKSLLADTSRDDDDDDDEDDDPADHQYGEISDAALDNNRGNNNNGGGGGLGRGFNSVSYSPRPLPPTVSVNEAEYGRSRSNTRSKSKV